MDVHTHQQQRAVPIHNLRSATASVIFGAAQLHFTRHAMMARKSATMDHVPHSAAECDIELDFMVGDHLLRCRMLGNYWTVTLLKNLSAAANSPFLINNRLLLTEHKKYVGRARFSAESNNKSKVTLTDARLLFVECEIEAIIGDRK
jgi:hypothetical protein